MFHWRSYIEDYRKRCRRLINCLQALYSYERSPTLQFETNQWVRADLAKYKEESIEKPEWIDEDVHRGRMLSEFEAHIKIPILSENEACNKLLDGSAPEMPTCTADGDVRFMEKEDILLEYWYWSCVGSDNEMFTRSVCSVYIEGNVENPRRMEATWRLPLQIIVEETRYAFPLIACLKKNLCGRNTGYGLDVGQSCMLALDKLQLRLLKLSRPCDWQILFVKYSTFDSVVPHWVINICFNAIKQKLDFGVEIENERMIATSKIGNERRFRKVVENFVEIPIRIHTEPKTVILRKRGIPSGSYFSNVIRTMSNFLMTRILCYAIFKEKPRLNRFHGDKCMLVFDSRTNLDIKAFNSCAEKSFGIVIDEKRTCITANVDDFHAFQFCCDGNHP